jgi:hypothetical protein
MRVKAKGDMQSNSDVKVSAQVEPIAFTASAGGGMQAEVGPVSAGVGEIPLKLVIPFLRPGRSLQVVAAIGDIHLQLSPFSLRIEGASIDLQGVLGAQGLRGAASGKVSCRTGMELDSRLAGRFGTLTIELEEEDVE